MRRTARDDDDPLVEAHAPATRTRSTTPGCARGRSTSTSARTASARTCTCRSRPPGSATNRSTTSSSSARPGWARRRWRTSSAARWACHPHHVGPGAREARRPGGHAHQPARRRHPVHRRDPPPAADDRGDPLPGDGGLRARHRHRRGPERADGQDAGGALHADRRDDARGLLTSPLRARFGIVHRLDYYPTEDLEEIVRRSARMLERADRRRGGAREIARRSRGTPRIANRLLRRVRDYAQVRADGDITERRGARGARAARGGRARLRRDGRAAAARPSSRSSAAGPVGLGTHRRGDRRGGGRHRGHLRAVPDPDRLPRPHAARPRGHGARVSSTSGCKAPGKDRDCGERERARATDAHQLRWRHTCRRACSTTTTSRRWSTRPTSGSCSAPASRTRHIVEKGVATSDLGQGGRAGGDRARPASRPATSTSSSSARRRRT